LIWEGDFVNFFTADIFTFLTLLFTVASFIIAVICVVILYCHKQKKKRIKKITKDRMEHFKKIVGKSIWE